MFRKRTLVAIACLEFFVLPSCLVRRRPITPAAVHENRPLLTATKEELIQRVRDVSDPIQSFLMRADLSPTITNPSQQAVTEYATIGAYILYRRPDDIRVIGQDPVLHTTIFDMASTDNQFRLYIPSRDRVYAGASDVPGTSKNKLENLRPTAFLTSLLVNPPAAEDVTLLENDTDASKAVYILIIVGRDQGQQLTLNRNIYFSRYTLQITRQKTFDSAGNPLSETSYSDWKPYNGVSFPSKIDINRPQDDYQVQLTVTSMDFNTPEVTAEKFVLNPPPDVEVQQLK